MIGCVSYTQEMEAYLTKKDIKRLKTKMISGPLMIERRNASRDSSFWGTMKIKVDNKLNNLTPCDFEMSGENFNVYDVSISSDSYCMLSQENKLIGLRFIGAGARIDMMEESKADEIERYKYAPRHLKARLGK